MHADYICTKRVRKLKVVGRKNSGVLGIGTVLNIYNTTVLLHFTYCATNINHFCKEDAEKLQKHDC